ncbi:MAG: signal peptidase II [Lachnospiraceae bacterium]|nr:signal peptidase II [Lachnospiraceae bacterium]
MAIEKTETGKKAGLIIFDLILTALLIAADRVSKIAAVNRLMGKEDYVLIDGVLRFHYLENRGAAFSMLQDAKVLFVLATAVMLVAVCYILMKVPTGKKYLAWHFCLSMIAAGGIGNLVDRLRYSYVIDFIYFDLINFPVFNVADICVTVAVAVLVIFILLVWKDEDTKFLELSFKKQKS